MFTNSTHVSPKDPAIDSRDLFNRRCHLASRQRIGTWGLSKEEHEELRSLEHMQELMSEDKERASEWRAGVPVVNDSHFTAYALAFAKDIGMPLDELNPDAVVADVRAGCRPIDYMGRTFWVHG